MAPDSTGEKDDIEHQRQHPQQELPAPDDASSSFYYSNKWTQKLDVLGVENRGILPVPEELRTDTKPHRLFFIWFTANFNILSFSAGSLGPIVFELGTRDACLVILFFNLLCCVPPAYFCTWGPKFGMRQMVASRYTYGFYGVIIPAILNLMNMCGFCILNAILGGQTLASASSGNLSWTIGIVIIAVISLFLSFCGYRVISWYDKLAWIPILLVFLCLLGVAGPSLSSPLSASVADGDRDATAKAILGFGAVIAGFVITYSSLSSDFSCYFRKNTASWKIFLYSYFGFLVPIVTLQSLGAAFLSTAPSIPAWSDAQSTGGLGALLHTALSTRSPQSNMPVPKGFASFLLVLTSLSVIGNISLTFYSIVMNLQIVVPMRKVARTPRWVGCIAIFAIVLPLAIVGQHRFYDTLTNFLGLIGYWSASYIAALLCEHLLFRSPPSSLESPSSPMSRPSTAQKLSYHLDSWNVSSQLPTGIPAIFSGIVALVVAVLCMEQVWYTGPIAERSGDIGFEMAFVVTAILYVPLRWCELLLWRRV